MAQITVIVPVYNCEKWLPRCIGSVTGQTFTDLEILLIDDGSKDGSGAVCDRFAAADPRVRVIHQQNRGVGAVRNRAVSLANSDLLMFLDSDDWLAPEAVEHSFALMQKLDCDIVMFGIDMMSLSEKFQKHHSYYGEQRIFENGAALEEYLEGHLPVSFPAKLWKKDLFAGRRFPEGRAFEDVSTIHEFYAASKRMAFLPEQLYFRRQRPGSLSKQMLSSKKERDNLLAYRELLSYLERTGHAEVPAANAEVLRSALSLLLMDMALPCLTPEERKETEDLVRSLGKSSPLLRNRYRRIYASFCGRRLYMRWYALVRLCQQAIKKITGALRLRLVKGAS